MTTEAEKIHADCTECPTCGAGWDEKIRREVPPVHPQAEDRDER